MLLRAPQILQNDSGYEFTVFVISELRLLWPDLLVVYGKTSVSTKSGIIGTAELRCERYAHRMAWRQ